MEAMRIGAPGDGVPGLGTDYDAEMLFDHATVLQQAGRCDEAVGAYDRLEREFPESRLRSPALYHSGLCLEDRAELPRAADKFRALLALPSRDARDARAPHLARRISRRARATPFPSPGDAPPAPVRPPPFIIQIGP